MLALETCNLAGIFAGIIVPFSNLTHSIAQSEVGRSVYFTCNIMHDTHDHASWAAEYYKHFGFATRLKNNTQKRRQTIKKTHTHWAGTESLGV